jgi:hypothetical protein
MILSMPAYSTIPIVNKIGIVPDDYRLYKNFMLCELYLLYVGYESITIIGMNI